jgi:hypothetical protein
MGKHDISDKQAIRFLPTVTVVVATDAQQVLGSIAQQDYAKIKTVHRGVVESVPRCFNDAIQALDNETTNQIVVCLDAYHWFSSPSTITRVVEKFLKDNFVPAGIYTDDFRIDNRFAMPEYLPAFDAPLFVDRKIGLDSSIFMQPKYVGKRPFNENLTHLYFLDFLHRTSMQFGFVHLAEPLCCVAQRPGSMEADIRILNEYSG